MDYLWAPWRMRYILQEKPEGCFLCDAPAQDDDEKNLLLYRGKYNFVIMNSYPYNPGHLLIATYRHSGLVEELPDVERDEHFELVCRCIRVQKEAMNPAGFNFGANLGAVAGAGVEDHFHSHVVPRWTGDTNYIPVLADLRVVPQALEDTYKILKEKFK